jgi:hypothetical protein
MKRLLAAAILMIMTAGALTAQEASPILPAQLKKILKFVDTIGVKQEFPPPTAQILAISADPKQALPVVAVVTDDQRVYFCRSQLNADDYIIWAHVADSDNSYIFLTRSDLKLIRALYLEGTKTPQLIDSASSQVRRIYKDALVALAKDVDASATH